jgi:hypothetical protein
MPPPETEWSCECKQGPQHAESHAEVSRETAPSGGGLRWNERSASEHRTVDEHVTSNVDQGEPREAATTQARRAVNEGAGKFWAEEARCAQQPNKKLLQEA